MIIEIPDKVQKIIDIIQKNGFKVYVVGGYIRDYILNRTSCDFDLATDALVKNLKDCLKEYKIKYINELYGCISLELLDYSVEITTFRKELEYANHRYPIKIEFIDSLEEDLKRRDFTINALAYNNQKIIDHYGGLIDIDERIIRTIGKADEKFKEDALRILRALRFSSSLNFDIDQETKKAIKENYRLLQGISFNNLYREIKGILKGDRYIDILTIYAEELKEVYKLDYLRLGLFTEQMNEEEKEAMFFLTSKYKIKNKYLESIPIVKTKEQLKKVLMIKGYNSVYDILHFEYKYFNKRKKEINLLDEIINQKECYNLEMLAINGDDLLKNHVKKEKIGMYLKKLLMLVIKDNDFNKREVLLKYLKEELMKEGKV